MRGAKAWVAIINLMEDSDYTEQTLTYQLMERYANHKSQMLEAQVLDFFMRLKNVAEKESHPEKKIAYQLVLENYKTYFNIETLRHG